MLVEIFRLAIVIDSRSLVTTSWTMIPLRHYFRNNIKSSFFRCNKMVEVMGIVSGTARTSCNSLFYPAFCSCKDFFHAIHVGVLSIPQG